MAEEVTTSSNKNDNYFLVMKREKKVIELYILFKEKAYAI